MAPEQQLVTMVCAAVEKVLNPLGVHAAGKSLARQVVYAVPPATSSGTDNAIPPSSLLPRTVTDMLSVPHVHVPVVAVKLTVPAAKEHPGVGDGVTEMEGVGVAVGVADVVAPGEGDTDVDGEAPGLELGELDGEGTAAAPTGTEDGTHADPIPPSGRKHGDVEHPGAEAHSRDAASVLTRHTFGQTGGSPHVNPFKGLAVHPVTVQGAGAELQSPRAAATAAATVSGSGLPGTKHLPGQTTEGSTGGTMGGGGVFCTHSVPAAPVPATEQLWIRHEFPDRIARRQARRARRLLTAHTEKQGKTTWRTEDALDFSSCCRTEALVPGTYSGRTAAMRSSTNAK